MNLKYGIKFFTVIFLLMGFLSGCKDKKKNDPTPAQVQLEKLAGSYKTTSTKTWAIQSVHYNSTQDRTADWTGFTLSLSTDGSNHSFSTSGAFSPGPWPTSGTWTYGGTADNPNVNLLIRDDQLEMASSVNIDATTLTLVFTFDDTLHSGGRVEAVNGEYIFKFTAQ